MALTDSMRKMHTFGMMSVFDYWPSLAEMASDLGYPYQTVASWKRRGIPAARALEVRDAIIRRVSRLSVEEVLRSEQKRIESVSVRDAA